MPNSYLYRLIAPEGVATSGGTGNERVVTLLPTIDPDTFAYTESVGDEGGTPALAKETMVLPADDDTYGTIDVLVPVTPSSTVLTTPDGSVNVYEKELYPYGTRGDGDTDTGTGVTTNVFEYCPITALALGEKSWRAYDRDDGAGKDVNPVVLLI